MAVVLGLAFSSHIHLPRHPLIHMQTKSGAERDPQENAPLHNHNSTMTR